MPDPKKKNWLRKDKHGIDVWRIEIFLGKRADGKPDRRKMEFHGTEAEYKRYKAVFYAEELKKKETEQLAVTRMTVAQWSEQWLEILQRNKRSANTIRSYRDMLRNRILPALGAHQLAELTPRQIQHWLEQMEHQRRVPRVKKKTGQQEQDAPEEPLLSTKYIAMHFRLVRTMLREAVYRFLITVNPADAVRAPREESPEAIAYTNEHLTPVLAALDGYDTMFRVLVLLGLTTGARRGELIGLEWQHINFDAATMTIAQGALYDKAQGGQYVDATKTRKSMRTLSLTPDMVGLLNAWHAEQAAHRARLGENWKGGDYVFTTQRGTWININYADTKVLRFVRKHNLPSFHLHGLRHTVATHLLAGRLPLADTAAYLGHSQASTTLNIYTHALAAQQTRAAEIIADAFPLKIPPSRQETAKIEHE